MYEHSERHGFPSEWIGITFSITTFWNGMIAIFAGIISNVTAESLGFGPVAPFVVALLPLVVCGILVVSRNCHPHHQILDHSRRVCVIACVVACVVTYVWSFSWWCATVLEYWLNC